MHDDDFNVWHPQYNGFGGYVFFEAADQQKLPWTTTKRDLDGSSPLYRRAIARMKELTEEFMAYTQRRKSDPDAAKIAESRPTQVDVSALKVVQPFKLPSIGVGRSRSDTVTISFKRSKAEVEEVKSHLGNITMSARDVGIHAFDYFLKAELGK